jgi:hypothetical protein
MLEKRVQQRVPLEALDLRTCMVPEPAVRMLAGAVGKLEGPEKTLMMDELAFSKWRGGNEEGASADTDSDSYSYDFDAGSEL